MPVQEYNENGKPGYRWSEGGDVFTYDASDPASAADAQRRAFLQGLAAGDTAKMNATELGAARALGQHLGVELRKDAGGNLILAWWLAGTEDGRKLAEALAIPGGEAVEDLHLTLIYLGDPMRYDIALIGAAIKIWTSMWYCYPLEGVISGQGRFVGEDDTDVLLALPDIPGLQELRRSLCEILCQVGVFPPDSGHGYTPHITLAYVPRHTPSPAPYAELIPFELDNVTVAAGAARAVFELPEMPEPGVDTESMAPYFAQRASREVEKAGRVLSGKNMKLVTAAKDAISALMEAAKRGEIMDADEETMKMLGEDELEMEYACLKDRTSEEERYTFGPLYAPERKDAHGEWTDAAVLQKAVWDYVRSSADNGRRINLQHEDSGASTVGEWVEVCAWPYETTITVKAVGGEERELTMPAGTIYMGVVWDEPAWENGIKKGVLNGYSLGGRAMRVAAGDNSMENMGDKVAKLRENVAKGWHEYKGEADGACETCSKAFKDGTHIGNGADGDPAAKESKKAVEAVEARHASQLDRIREAAIEDEERHVAQLAKAEGAAEEARTFTSRVVEVVKLFTTQKTADTHIHLPEQNVIINDAPVEPDVEDG